MLFCLFSECVRAFTKWERYILCVDSSGAVAKGSCLQDESRAFIRILVLWDQPFDPTVTQDSDGKAFFDKSFLVVLGMQRGVQAVQRTVSF